MKTHTIRYSPIQNILFGKIKKITDRYLLLEKDGLLREDDSAALIEMLRHERLIHLIVLCVTAIAFFVIAAASLLIPSVVTGVLMAVVALFLFCYLHYYFFLENITQHFEFGALEKRAGMLSGETERSARSAFMA